MKEVIGSVFVGLVALSLVAAALTPPAAAPGVTRLFWASGANPYRVRQIEQFNEMHPSIELRLDSSNNRFEKIIVQTSSGVGPDLYDALTGSFVQSFVESGVAWDISEAASQGFAANVDAWPAVVNEICYADRQYGYPANVGTFVILYNKNVFDRFGVPYPSGNLTWDEYVALLRKVSGVPPGGGPRVFGTSAMEYSGRAPAPLWWKMVLYSRRGQFFSEDGTEVRVDTADMRAAFESHRAAIFEHGVLASVADLGSLSGHGGWGGGATTHFAEGKFATILQSKAAVATLRGFVEDQKRRAEAWRQDPEWQRREPCPPVLRIGAVRIPAWPDFPFSCVALSQTVLINPASERREAALTFLRFLASEKYARMVEPYGIPPNPRHLKLDYPITHPELAEHELTRLVADSLKHGYQTRKSPFLLDFDVERVLSQQISRMEANPSLETAALLREAQAELTRLMQLNLRRNPALAARFAATAPHRTRE